MIEEYREVRSKSGVKILLIVLIVVLLSLVSLKLISNLNKLNLFSVKKVQIYGNLSLKDSSIAKLINLDNNLSLVLFNKKKAIRILESDGRIKKVEIAKIYPDTLRIYIVEKDRFALISINNENYFLSKDGTVLMRSNETQKGYPLITIKSFNDDIIIGEKLNNCIIPSILDSIPSIKNEYPGFYRSIDHFLLDKDGVYLKLKNHDTRIYLGDEINREKLEKLRALLIVLKSNYSKESLDIDRLEINMGFSNAAVRQRELKDEL